ncbi:MAG: DNA recombination protein RmuC [Phycisphaerae bacterium]
MTDILLGVLVLLVLGAIALLAALLKQRKGGGAVEGELRRRIDTLEQEAEGLRGDLDAARQARVQAETRVEAERKNLDEQRRLLAEAETQLKDAFAALSAKALKEGREQFLGEAGEHLKPIRQMLDVYQKRLEEIEKARNKAYGNLQSYLNGLHDAQEGLRTQTTKLETALRGSTRVRGQWGQLALQRVVELAGMSKHCDFDEQSSTETEEGRQVPDLTVHLPDDRLIVVDAKAPFDAYYEAVEASDESSRKEAMARHAKAVKGHVRALAQKAYWSQFKNTPEYVVLFLPGESFYSAALEADPDLMEDAFRSNVVLASPATLIGLLKAVAHGWRQQEMAENAERIGQTGRELYDRVCVFLEHFERIGDGLGRAAKAYDAAVGSYESRVRPSAERLAEQAATGRELPEPERVDASLRRLPEPEEDEEEA